MESIALLVNASPVIQRNRPVRIQTPVGEDVLLFGSMQGSERLGQPFEYELVLFSERPDLDYREVIGKNATITVEKPGDEPRYFNGFLSRFAQTSYDRRLCEYRATLVPWLWFLSRSADCRIYQNLTIPEILKQVFDNHGFSDVIVRLHEAYKPWEYCVQYRETALDFVSRLMEQEGIYYYFWHQNGKHSLVLCDSPGAHEELTGYEELQYRSAHAGSGVHDIVWRWIEQHEVEPGVYGVKDFDFKRPRRDRTSVSSIDRAHAASQMEHFDYLGEMNAESDGTRYSKVRLEQWQARQEIYSGEGDARGICAGMRFKLRGHPRRDLDKEYLTIGTEFRIHAAPFESALESGTEFGFVARFTAIPVTRQFRSPCVTPKPAIQGLHTAIVVGPAGEEIHTDKYGRVKVHFHWDRHGAADENASCWIRVAQVAAGKGWGTLSTPRVGQEVVVNFLDGDPDRPLIIGRVYNEASLPPYELPAHKTISTQKTNSSKGGNGFNEIRCEDKKGEEQIFIHGEKNLDIRVKSDAYETVGQDRHVDVKRDQFEHIENNRHAIVDADHKEQVGKDRHLKVTGKEAKEVGGSLSLSVGGDVIEAFKANHSEQTAQNLYLKAMGIVIEGLQGITLKVGGNSVVVDPAGVTVKGAVLTFDGGMTKINSGPGSPPASGQAGKALLPAAATAAVEADMAKPGAMLRPAAPATKPHKAPKTKEEQKRRKSWIEIELVDEHDAPVPGEAYSITLPDESVAEGTLDERGFARVDGIDPGTCKITFPNLDKETWRPA